MASLNLWIEMIGDMSLDLVLGKSLHALSFLQALVMRIVVDQEDNKQLITIYIVILEIIHFQPSPPMKLG
jgi:hypothetical protein